MNPEARVAYVQLQTAAMLIELESMKVANANRARLGEAPAYGEEAFMQLFKTYGVDGLIPMLRD